MDGIHTIVEEGVAITLQSHLEVYGPCPNGHDAVISMRTHIGDSFETLLCPVCMLQDCDGEGWEYYRNDYIFEAFSQMCEYVRDLYTNRVHVELQFQP